MNIQDMLKDIIAKEGGFVNHPADRGGATKYGITQKTLSKYLEKMVTVEDVKGLDIETAKDIYELRYYRAPKIDRLPEGLQHFLFDCAVNHGPRRAIKFLQQVCNDSGYGPLTVDGLMGPKSKAQAAACYEELGDWMLVALVEERQLFYSEIVEHNESQGVFLAGWLNRARSFLPDVA
ncbi:glycosyl hydrolase 108 family protein [Alteromonadaceae bacterium BrNp21-10]|nr:glycosyl hydrolase 108 family protein [Alteromonadaceae bacterium BrNp21-10]